MNNSKLLSSLSKKGAHKLSEYIQAPVNYEKTHQIKKLNATFHRQQTRMQTDVTQTPATRDGIISSFYDGFEFVDRLTNNKMVYRDVRRSTNSLIHMRTSASNRSESRPHLNNLLRIYKKTKTFQMNSLKNKIFKKIESGKQLTQKSIKNIQDPPELKQRKFIKSTSLTYVKPETASEVMQRSRRKNRLKQFLQKTVMDMNKAELQRMVSKKDTVKDEVLQFNEDLLQIKCTMDRDKISDLMYLREKQQHELGRTSNYKQKETPIVFKDLTNLNKNPNGEQQTFTQVKKISEDTASKKCGKLKRKKTIQNEQNDKNDNFLQKMLNHARNTLRRQCEYLIPPKKLNVHSNMVKKSRDKFFENTMKTESDENVQNFSFDKKPQSPLVSHVRQLVSRQSRKQFFTCGGQRPYRSQMSDDGKKIISLLKNNYISNLGLQLMTNPNSCWVKDSKGNNLLHLAVKHQRTQVIDVIFRKVPYRTCRILLNEKNNNKKTPLEMAKLVVDATAVEMIEKFVEDNRQNQIMENWIANGEQQ